MILEGLLDFLNIKDFRVLKLDLSKNQLEEKEAMNKFSDFVKKFGDKEQFQELYINFWDNNYDYSY